MFNFIPTILLAICMASVVSCGSSDNNTSDEEDNTDLNSAPVAVTGLDQSVQVGSTVYLDASDSYDVDLDPLTYEWLIISRPAGSSAILTNNTSFNPSFIPDYEGVYVVQLIVNDGSLISLPGSISVEAVIATPARGSYDYTLKPAIGLRNSRTVEFHPDGSYAVILEFSNFVHIYHWQTQTLTTFDLTPVTGVHYWQDIAFNPNGGSATLVGYHDTGTDQTGIVYRLDDAAWRQQFVGTPGDAVFAQVISASGSNPYYAIQYPWQAAGLPVILERVSDTLAGLREFNQSTGNVPLLGSYTNTSAGCDDIAFANSKIGEAGILMVCGTNGASAYYYTEPGGISEWRDVGNISLGNVTHTAAHRNGDYALVVSLSDRRLYRFQDGLLNTISEAPVFTTLGIMAIKFQGTGQRALIVGRAAGTPLSAAVLEFRHDEYLCPTFPSDCGLTDVSIPNFDLTPYNATSSTYLNDATFRPGCDGGLIVGGESTISLNIGMIIEFQISGEGLCR